MGARINARIDPALGAKLARISRTTGETTTEVLKTAIERYHAALDAEARPYDTLVGVGFVGCADGPVNLSATYKEALGPSLEHKLAGSGREPRPRRARRKTKTG